MYWSGLVGGYLGSVTGWLSSSEHLLYIYRYETNGDGYSDTVRLTAYFVNIKTSNIYTQAT